MTKIIQGAVVYVDLNPAKCVKTNEIRPCVVVSNNQYNRLLNTIIVAPISSSNKYQEEKYQQSPLFLGLPDNPHVKGTILLQHLRSIDPKARIKQPPVYQLEGDLLTTLKKTINQFF